METMKGDTIKIKTTSNTISIEVIPNVSLSDKEFDMVRAAILDCLIYLQEALSYINKDILYHNAIKVGD